MSGQQNNLAFHEAANIFPLDEEHVQDLADDIRKHGQQIPIETLDGKIIDGRRRFLACERAGVKPKFKDVSPPDPVAYVLSLNLHRRHLSPSQLAMVGAKARGVYEAQAKERMVAGGGDKKSKSAKSGVETLPPPIHDTGKARDQAGKAVGVSGKSIDHATKVIEHGIPELAKAVDEGRMAVSVAARVASGSKEEQRDAIDNPSLEQKVFQFIKAKGQDGATDDEIQEAVGGDQVLRPRRVALVDKGEVEDSGKTRKSSKGRESTVWVVASRTPSPQNSDAKHDAAITLRGVGVFRAHEAINSLTRIPKNDALRKRGFQIVMDWIKHNK